MAGVVLIAVAALCAGLVRTPIFRARVVKVQGNVGVSDAKIRRLAGIDDSTNVMLFDGPAAGAGIERDPWIARATISRRLPSTIDVQIRERSAMAAVEEPGGYALVADDGTRLTTVAKPKGVPVIASAASAPGTSAEAAPTQEQLAAAARALGDMPDPVRRTVDRVSVTTDGTLELALHGGTRVVYGEPTQTEEKARSLGAVLRWASSQGERLGSIDLSAPQAPTASAPFAGATPTSDSPPSRTASNTSHG